MGSVRVSYTSLRDIMGLEANSDNEMWNIKNPLLKHQQNCFCLNAATLFHAFLAFFSLTKSTHQQQKQEED